MPGSFNLRVGNVVMTQRTIVAETGEEIPPGSVGQVEQLGGQIKVAIKHKGDVVYVTQYKPADFTEVW